MELNLHDEEASVLHRVLASHISNLLAEIGSTDDYDLRRKLQAEEVLVRNLVSRLSGDHRAIDRWADEAGASV